MVSGKDKTQSTEYGLSSLIALFYSIEKEIINMNKCRTTANLSLKHTQRHTQAQDESSFQKTVKQLEKTNTIFITLSTESLLLTEL